MIETAVAKEQSALSLSTPECEGLLADLYQLQQLASSNPVVREGLRKVHQLLVGSAQQGSAYEQIFH